MRDACTALALVAVFLLSVEAASAQADPEAAIRALEAKEVTAILAGDVPTLESIWHEDFVVNSPANRVHEGRVSTVALVRGGQIDYHQFDRTVERVTINGDVAVAMGAETVRPKAGPQAGATLSRRYSNIYKRDADGWRMIARHANIRPPTGQTLDPVTPPR